jgi:hypothetical protein
VVRLGPALELLAHKRKAAGTMPEQRGNQLHPVRARITALTASIGSLTPPVSASDAFTVLDKVASHLRRSGSSEESDNWSRNTGSRRSGSMSGS